MSAPSDLAKRWRSARRAALRAVLLESQDSQTEQQLLVEALSTDAERVLRLVFDNSLTLGEGFRAYFRVDVPLTDLVSLLPLLETPCLPSSWTRHDDPPHHRTERTGCHIGLLHDRACDYFREAIQGLVLGLTGTVYHARYESLGHGGKRCVDALYVQSQSPARFGPIPESLRLGLEQVQRTARMFDSSVRLDFLGLSENTLSYTLESGDGPGNLHLTTVVEQALRRRYPDLITRDASPRAVLSDSA
jgi:hypothetical protein